MSKRAAILIGCGTFINPDVYSPLRCPSNDAKGFAEALKLSDDFLYDELSVLIDCHSVDALTHINRSLHDAGAQDSVVLFFSGHGSISRHGKLRLVTSNTDPSAPDATSIPLDLIANMVRESYARRIILVLDCCYSGAAGKSFSKAVNDVQMTDAELGNVRDAAGVCILTASTSLQIAEEKEGDEYSVFTKHLLHGITTGEGDLDGDGFIGVEDIYRYVSARIENSSQKPKKWGIDIEGELVLARSPQSAGLQLARLRQAWERTDSTTRTKIEAFYLLLELHDLSTRSLRQLREVAKEVLSQFPVVAHVDETSEHTIVLATDIFTEIATGKNRDPEQLRARLRRELIPSLKNAWPREALIRSLRRLPAATVGVYFSLRYHSSERAFDRHLVISLCVEIGLASECSSVLRDFVSKFPWREHDLYRRAAEALAKIATPVPYKALEDANS